MAFAKGSAAIEKAAQRSMGNKFVPVIRWDDKETKYLQFLQPLEEWVTVLMHPFVWIEADNEDGKLPAMFISRRDPELDGESGYDPLVTRFKQQPVYRTIALAVELEKKSKTSKTYEVVKRQYETRDGETKEVPNVGLVIQSPHTFSKHAKAQVDEGFEIEEYVWAVKRQGASTDTTYSFSRMVDAVELPEEVDEFLEEYDFDAYLEDLASEQRMRDLVDTLPDDWVVNQFAKKKQTKQRSGSSTRRRVQVEESEDNGDNEEETSEAEPKTRSSAASRTRRFAALRESAGRK